MHSLARRIAFRSAALMLLAGAAVLGVLQVRWVNAVTRDETERLRASLSLGASRVRREADDEVRVLASLMSVSATDFEAGRWEKVAESIDFWYEMARFPELLAGAYIIPEARSDSGLVFSAERRAFVEATLAPELLGYVRAALSAGSLAELREGAARAEEHGYFVMPVYDRPPTDSAVGEGQVLRRLGAVAARLSRETLYASVIPDLMRRYLEGFPYRVRETSPEGVLMQEGDIPSGARPEATVSLSALSFGDPRWSSGRAYEQGPQDGRPASSSPYDDPSLRYWLLRLRAEGEPQSAQAAPDLKAAVLLEVFHPHGSIAGVLQARRILSICVSIGILTVLVLSALVLYRLYRRSARLRASEQEFVASMSHELRTPITVIQATSENLRRGVVRDAGRVARYAGVINDQIRRLAGMVESILFYSGLQSGSQRKPTLAEIEPANLAAEIVAPLREVAAERGMLLRVGAEGLPARVWMDGAGLRLVIENLLMNAIRHADPPGVTLTLSRPEPGALRVVVEDDGPGIPAREQARVFEPFVRGERSAREQRPGSGLGLHLVRRVAGMLGGDVRLECPYDMPDGTRSRGCRFTVTVRAPESAEDG